MINTKIICDQIQNRIGAKLKVTFNVIKSPDKFEFRTDHYFMNIAFVKRPFITKHVKKTSYKLIYS